MGVNCFGLRFRNTVGGNRTARIQHHEQGDVNFPELVIASAMDSVSLLAWKHVVVVVFPSRLEWALRRQL